MKFGFWCLCGASMTGEVEPGGEQQRSSLEKVFRTVHRGEGHGMTDAGTARSVRRRQERQRQAEQQADIEAIRKAHLGSHSARNGEKGLFDEAVKDGMGPFEDIAEAPYDEIVRERVLEDAAMVEDAER